MQRQILMRSFVVAMAALLTLALPASTIEPGEADTDSPLVDILMSDGMTREEMVGLYRALAVGDFEPPPCEPGNEMFDDVPAGNLFCPWIEELARSGITSGCDADNYCPGDPVSRAQMAIFLVKTREAAREAARPMWAAVSGDNEIVAQSGGISIKGTSDSGATRVLEFPQGVNGRALVATTMSSPVLGNPGTSRTGIKVRACGDSPIPGGGGDCSLFGDDTPNEAHAVTFEEGDFAPLPFFIVVFP